MLLVLGGDFADDDSDYWGCCDVVAVVLVVGMLVLRLDLNMAFGFCGDVEEPPLLFKESQPHFRSGW